MDDINIITGVIGAVISVITMIAKISNGECLPKKEWILTERFSLFKRIYLFFKPLIDMVVSNCFICDCCDYIMCRRG